MYRRIAKLLSEAESEKRKAYKRGEAVRTVIPRTGGAVRTAQRGQETEVARPSSLLAPYKGRRVSAGLRTLQQVEKQYSGQNVGTIRRMP